MRERLRKVFWRGVDSIADGMASIGSLGQLRQGQLQRYRSMGGPARDAQNLRSDLEKVGGDMRIALEKAKKELKKRQQ